MSAYQRQTLSPRPPIAKRRPCADTTNVQSEAVSTGRADECNPIATAAKQDQYISQKDIPGNQENVNMLTPTGAAQLTPASLTNYFNKTPGRQSTCAKRRLEKPSAASAILRRLAIRVAAKLKQLGVCTHAQIVDAMSDEIRYHQGGHISFTRNGNAAITSSQEALRRRVYDAVSVLVATGVATRTSDGSVMWNWLFGADPRTVSLFTDLAARRAVVESKRTRLEALRCQIAALEIVVARNAARRQLSQGTNNDSERTISFPFMLVAMDHSIASAIAEAESPRREIVCITLGAPFQILDDRAIITLVAKDALLSGQNLYNQS